MASHQLDVPSEAQDRAMADALLAQQQESMQAAAAKKADKKRACRHCGKMSGKARCATVAGS
jgi:hypothetical protein